MNEPFFRETVCYNDSVFGWKPAVIEIKNNHSKLRILLLGDSFTLGFGLKDTERKYWQWLADDLNCDFFVAAMCNYGQTEQLLLLRMYLQSYKPDIVLLQVCGNDLWDN